MIKHKAIYAKRYDNGKERFYVYMPSQMRLLPLSKANAIEMVVAGVEVRHLDQAPVTANSARK
jgi:hypothetical protein